MKIGFSVVHASEVTTFPLSNLQEILPISRNRSKEIGFVEDPPHFFSIILDLTNIIFEALLNGLDELGETFEPRSIEYFWVYFPSTDASNS